LITQERFEAAIEQLLRVINTEQGAVRAAALRQVPVVVGNEIHHWLAPQQYPQAFKQLGQRQANFGEYPETASFFADLGSQAEYEVFGIVLNGHPKASQARYQNTARPTGVGRAIFRPPQCTPSWRA
jgi:hypothetical protein